MGGLHIGEILALNWASVDFASAQIRVTRGCSRGTMGTPKTKYSRRSVPLPEAQCQVLCQMWERAHGVEALVFPTDIKW